MSIFTESLKRAIEKDGLEVDEKAAFALGYIAALKDVANNGYLRSPSGSPHDFEYIERRLV